MEGEDVVETTEVESTADDDNRPFSLFVQDDEPKSSESDDDSDDEDEAPRKTITKTKSDDDDDADDDDKSEKKKKASPKKEDKPKSRRRKVTRGKQEIEVDLDDEEGLMKLLSDPAKYTVKVDGKDQVITFDDLINDYERRSASYARMEKATNAEKAFKARMDQLRNDPELLEEFLRDEIGIEDPWKPVEAHYARRLQLKRMITPGLEEYDPEGYEAKMREIALKDAERKQSQIKAREEREARDRQQREAAQKFRDALPDHLKTHGLRHNDVTAGVIGQLLRHHPSIPMEGDKLAYEAARMLRDEVAHMLPTDPEELAEVLGEARLSALRERDLKHVRSTKSKKKAPEKAESQKKKTSSGGTLSDLLRNLG